MPEIPHPVHRYQLQATWQGSTGVGYGAYDRTHELTAPPAEAVLTASADPAFGGQRQLLNPEALLLAAASSCQLLSFLAVAARARIDVIAYHDQAVALMPEDDRPVRITEITLRPHITARDPASEERVRHLCEVAHRECYIANSVRSMIHVTPEITIVPKAT